jgi:hypothetical protein
MQRMAKRMRRLVAGLLVLAMLSLSLAPGAGASAAAETAHRNAAAASRTTPCPDHPRGAAARCCHARHCATPVLALAPSAQATGPSPLAGAVCRITDAPRLVGIATLPALHPPEIAA